MNILHLNDKVEISGGVEVYIEQLMEYLPHNGINTFWLGFYENQSSYSIKSYRNSLAFRQGLSFARATDALRDFISQKEIDLIHVHSISNPELLEACFEELPVVRSMHEPRIVCPGQGKFWRKSETVCTKPFGLHCLYHIYSEGCSNRHPSRVYSAMRNTYYEVYEASQKFKAIIAMSDFMMALAERANIEPGVLSLNPYFTPYIEEKSLLRQKSDTGKKRILFVGRLSQTKGVHYFINIGLDILQTRNDVIFEIVGDGYDRQNFEDMIPSGHKQDFIFYGWKKREDVNKILARSYLMVFPSIYPEAFGISGIEAMMAGKPVVGFNVGGVSTWLKNDNTGYLVVPKDTETMQKNIVELLDNRKTYNRFSKNARLMAIEEFSVEKHINKLVEMYKKVLES